MAKLVSDRIIWIEGLIMKTFGLTRIYQNFPLLDQWLNVTDDLTQKEIDELEYLRERLLRKVNSWNEETLKMKFIAFIIEMVGYDTVDFEGLFDLEMKGEVQNTKLSVITDYTIAKVTYDYIEQPYFYFHEYKQSKKSKDPVAQILLAMLLAQEKNDRPRPLYGCAVVGELWYFMVLQGKEYSVSFGYIATNPDSLKQIFLILKKFKQILLNELSV